MRPGQNKRMRGRNNNNNGGGNNRKGPNPLTRSYESNGPDVKIRGTAHHIGEKYLQLARDAQSSGDPVMAESYLQHAEHYFRLIATAQQAQQQAAYGYQRPPGEQAEADDDDGDDDFNSLPDRFASPAERVVTPPPQQPAPQPYVDRNAYNGGGERPAYEPRQGNERHNGERQPQQDRSYQDRPPQQSDSRPERYDNRQDRNRPDRQPYGDRGVNRNGSQERSGGYQDRGYADRQPAGTPDRVPQEAGTERQARDFDNRGPRYGNRRDFRDQPREPRSQDAEAPVNALPAFITAPVRVPTEGGEAMASAVEHVAQASPDSGAEDEGLALRPRRRRRVKADFADQGGEIAHEAPASDPVGD